LPQGGTISWWFTRWQITQLESNDAFGLIVPVMRKEPSEIPSSPISDGSSRKKLAAESGFLCGPSVGEFQQARLEAFEQVVIEVFIVVTGINVVRDFFAGDETAVQEHPGAASGSKGGGSLEQTGQQSQAVRGVPEVLRDFRSGGGVRAGWELTVAFKRRDHITTIVLL
jgi:hypothetical protein